MSACLPITPANLLNPQNPQQYLKEASVQQERALENLAGWKFDPCDQVLDIGSGPGKITASIAEQVPYGSVVGLDLNLKMCEQAREMYTLNNLNFIQGDACSLPFKESFDKITCFAVLSWIPLEAHQQIFNEIARALKARGKTLLRMSAEGDRPLNQAVGQIIKVPKWSHFFTNFISPAAYQNENRLREIAEQSKLNVIRVEDSTKISTFNSKEDFVKWLLTWEPHRLAINESERKQFMEDVVDQYCMQGNYHDKISITLPGILIELEKKETFSQFSAIRV